MDDERIKRRVLRAIVAAVLALGAATVVLALIPSVEVWNGWRRVETRSAAEHPWGMLVWGVVMLAPGALVWFRPQLSFACLWSMIAFGATMMWFVVTSDVPGRYAAHAERHFTRFVELWPATLFGYAVVLLIGGLVVALPVFCGAFAFLTGRRDGVRAQLPVARVVRR